MKEMPCYYYTDFATQFFASPKNKLVPGTGMMETLTVFFDSLWWLHPQYLFFFFFFIGWWITSDAPQGKPSPAQAAASRSPNGPPEISRVLLLAGKVLRRCSQPSWPACCLLGAGSPRACTQGGEEPWQHVQKDNCIILACILAACGTKWMGSCLQARQGLH